MKYKGGSRRDLNPCSLKMSYTLDPVCNHHTTCPLGYLHTPCGSSSVLANLQSHPPGYRGRLCDSTGNQTLTPKRQGGMIEEEPPDPIQNNKGPSVGGIPISRFATIPLSRFLLPLLQPSNEARIPYQTSRITNTKHLVLSEIR